MVTDLTKMVMFLLLLEKVVSTSLAKREPSKRKLKLNMANNRGVSHHH